MLKSLTFFCEMQLLGTHHFDGLLLFSLYFPVCSSIKLCFFGGAGVLCCFQMWPDLIQKAKDGGLDVIQTYVFWNGHEPSPGQVLNFPHFVSISFQFYFFQRLTNFIFFFNFYVDLWQYYFEDRYDLVRFVKLVKQAGLYVHLRIGPYVCAEWNFG